MGRMSSTDSEGQPVHPGHYRRRYNALADGHAIEVRHIGDHARLFVNGFGIASWPWGGPCANDSTGEEYAHEVARCLSMALSGESKE
jgi:hypothetical protein